MGQLPAADHRSHPASLASLREGPAQPIGSAKLSTATRKRGSQPGSWLWGWELWEEGRAPLEAPFCVRTPGTSPPSGHRDTGLWHFSSCSPGGGKTSLEPTGLASDPGNTQPGRA